MTEESALHVMQQALPRLKKQLGLETWRIDVRVGRLEPFVHGEVDLAAPYERASIIIDPGQLDDEVELLRVLRHELIHVALWPFQHFARVIGADDATGMSVAAFQAVQEFCSERLVRAVEGVMDAAGLPLFPAP